MKKIIHLAFALCLLFACSTTGLQDSVLTLNNNETIPLSDALDNLDLFLTRLNSTSNTKSVSPKSYSEDSIFAVGSTSFNKNDLEQNQVDNDTLMYVVNFDNDEGYSILAANKLVPNPVICLTEKGHISKELFTSAQNLFEGDNNSFENADDSLWVPILLFSYAKRTRANIIDPGDPGPIGGGNGPGGIIGPFLMTKWNQKPAPYNTLLPGTYAGCVVVAVAQIMAYEEYASTMIFNNVTCTWAAMKSVHTYPFPDYPGTTAGQNQIANFFYELGKPSNCNVTYNTNESNALDDDARKTLVNYGYSNATIHHGPTGFTNALHTIVRSQLFSGHPVYCGGMSSLSSGHAWVIDGYYAGLYHINWGWGGHSDGYYVAGLFDTTQRNSISSIDSGEDETPHSFTFGFEVITY